MVTQIEPFVVGFDLEVLDVIRTGEAVIKVERLVKMAPEEEFCSVILSNFGANIMILLLTTYYFYPSMGICRNN